MGRGFVAIVCTVVLAGCGTAPVAGAVEPSLNEPVEPAPCEHHCINDELDCDETDVDCGGDECSPCGTLRSCRLPDDCESGICAANKTCQSDSPALLLLTTASLTKDDTLWSAIGAYQSAFATATGMEAAYVEIDSYACSVSYGERAESVHNWVDIRRVLQAIMNATGATYLLVLGGPLVVPRPDPGDLPNSVATVPSDWWYLDFDDDDVTDEGYAVGRLPDIAYASEIVAVGLETATELHQLGGFTLDAPVVFSISGYATPPYGVCAECDKRETFYNLMQSSDRIFFGGHGSPTSISDGYTGEYVKINVDHLPEVDLRGLHPVIHAFSPCQAGRLYDYQRTLATEFIRAGAGAYLARETNLGYPVDLWLAFADGLEGGLRIGYAFNQAIIEAIALAPDPSSPPIDRSHHLHLYGDPTLRRR